MRDSKKTIWLLYHPPMEKARTGHVGLLITKDQQAVYYFSMYHACLPSDIRQKVKKNPLTAVVDAHIVSSYEDDVVMRGQSWVRTIDNDGREDESVPTLVATLPKDGETRQKYFNRGAYQYAIQLPVNINADIVATELQYISASAEWAYLAPLSRLIFQDEGIYNCSSAIDAALYKGSLTPLERYFEPSFTKMVSFLRLLYFAWIVYARPLSSDDVMTQLTVLPALWLFTKAVENAIDFIRINDRNVTPIGRIDDKRFCAAAAFFFLLNIAALPFTTNAADLFIFPTRLAKKAEREYGGKLFPAKSVDLPTLKKERRVHFSV